MLLSGFLLPNLSLTFFVVLLERRYTLCGTPGYLAPEVIMSLGHDCSSDHWSLGVLIYEMITGDNPFYFEGMDQMILFKSIVQDPHETPTGCTDEAVDIINGLLEKEAGMRLGNLARGETDILQHPWFQYLDLQAMRRREEKAPWLPPVAGSLDTSCFDDWNEIVDKQSLNFPLISERDQKEFEGF